MILARSDLGANFFQNVAGTYWYQIITTFTNDYPRIANDTVPGPCRKMGYFY